MAEDTGLMTAQALAEALDLTVETILEYTRENRIPYVELGCQQYRYRLADVKAVLAGSVGEHAGQYAGEPTANLTYEDYLELPEEPGYRFEILDGMLIREPSASLRHQRASRELQRILVDYFRQHDPAGEVFYSPLDVTLGDRTVVQPDLIYVSAEQKDIMLEARIDGSPTLLVEILSPSTSHKDRVQKLRVYQNAGVKHYWLVSPEHRSMECLSLQAGVYQPVAGGTGEALVEHPGFPGLTVNLGALW